MSLISSQTAHLSPDIINYDVQRLGDIKTMKSPKKQLEKVSKEFEAIFVTKMLNMMDKTVDKEGSIFGNDDKYMDKFKSFIYDEIGRDIAKNPRTSVGFAKQIYSQMERYLPKEPEEIQKKKKTEAQTVSAMHYTARNKTLRPATVFEADMPEITTNRVDKEI